MKGKKIIIKDEDGDIYTFNSIEEFVEFFAEPLGYYYQFGGEWMQ